MDRITMAFGPISDVTGFSHKAGMTFLEIQERLRKGHNDLVAAFNNLVSHVEGRNADLVSAFDAQGADLVSVFDAQRVELEESIQTTLQGVTIPAAEYQALVSQFNGLVSDFNTMSAEFDAMMLSNNANTMTDGEIAGLLDGN